MVYNIHAFFLEVKAETELMSIVEIIKKTQKPK